LVDDTIPILIFLYLILLLFILIGTRIPTKDTKFMFLIIAFDAIGVDVHV